jgi:hypothetical protein
VDSWAYSFAVSIREMISCLDISRICVSRGTQLMTQESIWIEPVRVRVSGWIHVHCPDTSELSRIFSMFV